MEHTQPTQKKHLNWLAAFVAAVVLLWVVSPRFNLSFNAGHMDEYNYLFTGKMLLSGISWPSHTYIFGCDVNWLLFALADTFTESIAGTRAVSAFFGLISIVGMYCFTQELWKNNWAAFLSAALLSLDAAHLFSSKYVSYDIISFCLFVWSLPCILLACSETPHYKRWLVLGASLMAFSVLSKYTVILNLPFIALLIAITKPKRALAGTLIISAILCSYAFSWKDELSVLLNHQLRGTHSANSTMGNIIARILEQQTPLYLLLLAALLLISFKSKPAIRMVFVLLVLSISMPLYHLHSENLISLYKHLLYNSVFILPIVAYALAILTQNKLYWALNCTLLFVIFSAYAIPNRAQLQLMENGFPNNAAILSSLPTLDKTDTILSENPYLFRYALSNVLPQANIKESNWFDNNKDGIAEPLDIKQAIWDRKFKFVYLNDQVHQHENIDYRDILEKRGYIFLTNSHYTLSTKLTKNTIGSLSLYQRSLHTTGPNGTSGASNE